MDTATRTLIERLKRRAHDPRQTTDMADVIRSVARPPASRELLDAAEQTLRFPLPSLLRDVYANVGNGGFGPGYGLLPVDDGVDETIVERTQTLQLPDPDDPLWRWPHGLLVVCHWGCNIYSCLDCTKPAALVIRFDPNGHDPGTPWNDAFLTETSSFQDWLEGWLSRRPVHERFVLYPSSVWHATDGEHESE